jgi:hypothetical protein
LTQNIDDARVKKASLLSFEKTQPLIDWNTETLLRLLQKTVDNRRNGANISTSNLADVAETKGGLPADLGTTTKPFNEVKEIVSLPRAKVYKSATVDQLRDISAEVSAQLRDFVAHIAQMYNDNHFHNFEHVRFTKSNAFKSAYFTFFIN